MDCPDCKEKGRDRRMMLMEYSEGGGSLLEPYYKCLYCAKEIIKEILKENKDSSSKSKLT